MKKWLCLLLAGVLTFSLAACRSGQNEDIHSTGSSGVKQADNTGPAQSESTGPAQTENTGATQPDNIEEKQPDPTEATQPESKDETNTEPGEKEYENPYSIREITDERVVITEDKKVFNNLQITLSVPADWKCLTARGEDAIVYYFQDPILSDKCQLAFDVTLPEFLYERTPEQYREFLSRSRQNLVIDSFTKESIQGYQCTKVVCSYTENNTKFVEILYDNLIDGRQLYGFRVIYPANQKDTYEPIFATIMDSIQFIQTK